MPKQMSKKKRPSMRRRRNVGPTSRNQTRYHRETVGFEVTFKANNNKGGTIVIAPDAYTGSFIPNFAQAYSAYFGDRFSPTWRAWRMIGWNATAMATESISPGTVLSMAPVCASRLPSELIVPGVNIPYPGTLAVMGELPNKKELTLSTSNSRNRASFRYTIPRRDMNMSMFQPCKPSGGQESGVQNNLPEFYITGFQYYLSNPVTGDEPVQVRLFGSMLVEFKDKQLWQPVNPDLDMEYLNIKSPQQQQQPVKRLNRAPIA